ncbi:hypothetical protein [Anabaena azotica]|uniref:Uncharacterized protein n=1 Tax=Anabaena azotica FACHB-119 TaxID=947527 RepID=A0ABR8DD01_9NOST|nr:hypothetical protein [Anabaena azotica]MBD2505110.1 hypothetical protein [Anabaena azotica FACHB-119]
MELGIFQKDALIEKLAKAFYAIQGYVVREDYRMQSGTHPHEKACVEMAFTAIEEVELAYADLDDQEEEIINWQQGQPLNEGQQYFFCKYGNFSLILLTNGSLTRTEAYLDNQRIYLVEEEVSPDEATRKLQEFLSTLVNQLQILSNIQFEEKSP